jgi:excisionase family DNA binding protein
MDKKCGALLRIPEAVKYLNSVISDKTLRGWVSKKRIEVVRIGGVVCIPVEALDRMIEHGRVPAVENSGYRNRCPR